MATGTPESFPFPEMATPDMDALMIHLDVINACREAVQERATAFVERPLPTYGRRVGYAVSQWLESVDAFASTANELQLDEAPQLMTDLFFREDKIRVDFLNTLTGDAGEFKVTTAPENYVIIHFNPEDEDDVLDVEATNEAFFMAAHQDFEHFETVIKGSKKGKIVAGITKLVPKIGESALDISKIAVGVLIAGKLLRQKD